jgi:hypothetical protein
MNRALGLATALALALTTTAHAQSGAEANRWAAWCTGEIGGTVQHSGGNPVCVPPAQGSTGYTANEQAMLNLAGQFGAALGAAIRQSMEQAARQAQIDRINRAWAAEQARQQAILAAEAQRRRNAELISSMHGSVGASELTMRGSAALESARQGAEQSELGLNRVGTSTLTMRTSADMFGAGGNAGETTTHDVVTRNGVEAPAAPGDVAGAPVDPTSVARVEQQWRDYVAALEARNAAQARLTSAESDRDVSRRIRQEAERHVTEVRARPPAPPPATPTAAPQPDNSLAEAERLLAEAINMDNQAGERLEDARSGLEGAEETLNNAQSALPPTPSGAAPTPRRGQ